MAVFDDFRAHFFFLGKSGQNRSPTFQTLTELPDLTNGKSRLINNVFQLFFFKKHKSSVSLSKISVSWELKSPVVNVFWTFQKTTLEHGYHKWPKTVREWLFNWTMRSNCVTNCVQIVIYRPICFQRMGASILSWCFNYTDLRKRTREKVILWLSFGTYSKNPGSSNICWGASPCIGGNPMKQTIEKINEDHETTSFFEIKPIREVEKKGIVEENGPTYFSKLCR